jgi:hypothetical protein
MEYTHRIEFPNGKGYTPCSQLYAQLVDERDGLRAMYEALPLDQWHRDDYERFSELENKLGVLQLNGHVGAAVRY